MTFFSDRELGEQPRILDELSAPVWRGLVALLNRNLDSNRFANSFPERCPDGQGVSGTSLASFSDTLTALIPAIEQWPRPNENPGTVVAMDLAEFGWRHVALPQDGSYHSFFRHSHLYFDVAAGRAEWRDELNLILRRNNVALELDEQGRAVRIGPPSARMALSRTMPASGDDHLDRLLETAVTKYGSPDPLTRREALEQLWDALERLKTLLHASNKKQGVTLLISRMTSQPEAIVLLDEEFGALTRLGNRFQIRHHELDKVPVDGALIDYFFTRGYALLDNAIRAVAPASPALKSTNEDDEEPF